MRISDWSSDVLLFRSRVALVELVHTRDQRMRNVVIGRHVLSICVREIAEQDKLKSCIGIGQSMGLEPLQEGRDVGGVRNEDRHGDGSGAVLGASLLEFELGEDPWGADLGDRKSTR